MVVGRRMVVGTRKKVERGATKTILPVKNKSRSKSSKNLKAMATRKVKMGAKSFSGKESSDSSQCRMEQFFGKTVQSQLELPGEITIIKKTSITAS